MNMMNKALAGLLAGVWLSGAALAAELAGQAPFGGSAFGQQSDQGTGVAYTQTFTAPANSVLDAIRWWGFHGPNSQGSAFDSFVVTIDGQPLSGTLTVVPGALFDEYTLDVTDAALTGSTLSVFNDSADVEWFWQSTMASGNPGAPDASGVAFSLIGSTGNGGAPGTPINEPGVPALLAAALAALAWRRRVSARS